MTETQVSNNLNWVAQNPGADYNWIYDQVYNTGGLSTTMNIWGSGAKLGGSCGSVYCKNTGIAGDLNAVASALANLGGIIALLSPNGSQANEVGQGMLTAAGALKTILSLCT